MNLGLEDRVAWVTGASGGIGAAVARALGAEGTRVAVGFHHDAETAQAVVGAILKGGGQAFPVECDMADASAAVRVVDSILTRWARLDVLVACAWQSGGWPNPDREDIAISADEDWRVQLEANVGGTAHAVRAVLPAMKRGGWGRIVLISSGAAEDGQPGLEAYAAAKAALHGLNRSLALGLGRAGILSNVVMPGFVETDRNRRFVPRFAFDQRAAATPTGRLATTQEIASVVTFLASDVNRSVTGEAVRVTGGM